LSGEIYSNAGLGMMWIEPALKGGANVIINVSGDNARLLQTFGDKQMVDQVLIRLHTFYPLARGAFTGYEIRRYSTDPSTGGAYLAFGPGQISKFWRLWERPLQRVIFAGEHTDAMFPGTLEGALRSGERAASQAQDLLAGKSFDPVVKKPEPVVVPVAKPAEGGFFSNLFGGKPAAPAPTPVAPAPVAPVAPAPVVAPVVVAPVVAPVPVKAEPAKPAVKKATHPAPKKSAEKSAVQKKPAEKKPVAKKPAAKTDTTPAQ